VVSHKLQKQHTESKKKVTSKRLRIERVEGMLGWRERCNDIPEVILVPARIVIWCEAHAYLETHKQLSASAFVTYSRGWHSTRVANVVHKAIRCNKCVSQDLSRSLFRCRTKSWHNLPVPRCSTHIQHLFRHVLCRRATRPDCLCSTDHQAVVCILLYSIMGVSYNCSWGWN
jgi:hypothetical protein